MAKTAKRRFMEMDEDQHKKRMEAYGNQFDQSFLSQFKVKKLKNEGDYRFRILPTPAGSSHWGLDVWMHSSVGPDNGTYICPNKMNGDACPICEAIKQAIKEGDDEFANEIRAYQRILYWIIDRETPDEGPMLFQAPITLDKAIVNLSYDKRSGEFYNVYDPEEGYDVEFVKKGVRRNTKYEAIQIARRSTSLSRDQKEADQWLDYVEENPLTSVLNIYDYDHILEVFEGNVSKSKKSSELETRASGRGKSEEEEDPKPKRRERVEEPAEETESRPRARRAQEDDEPEAKPSRGSRKRAEEPEEEEEPKPKSRTLREEPEDDDLPSKGNQVKVGDAVTWEYRNKTHRGEVTKLLDDEGKIRVLDEVDDQAKVLDSDDYELAPKKSKEKITNSKASLDEDDEPEEKPKSRRQREEESEEDEAEEEPKPKSKSRHEKPEDEDEEEDDSPRRSSLRDRITGGLKGKK